MKKIGIVNIDTSHPFCFAQKMEANPDMEMQYSKLFNNSFRGNDEVNWFIEKYNMQNRAESLDELAESTDIGFIQSCNWEDHIAEALPFIERGKPVFIDKPMVGSVKDVAKIRELVANGAKIIGSSSARYAEEIQEFLAKPVEERGEVITVHCEAGVDEFNYAVHAGEILSEIAGAKGISCRFIGKVVRAGGECEVFAARFENGVIGTYCTYLRGGRPFNVSIITTKGSFLFKINNTKIYEALLRRISSYLKTGEAATADVDMILNVTEFMLCGKRSRDFENGREVMVSELSEDDSFDGGEFQRAYGSRASVTYKD